MAAAATGVSADVKLKRFLYTSSEQPQFVTGDPDRFSCYNREKLTCVAEYLKTSEPETLFNIIEIVHSEGLIPRREAVFFVLAVATISITSQSLKHRAYRTLVTLIKDSKDLCLFIKHITKLNKKFGSGVGKLIGSYYNKKEPLELVDEIIQSNGHHSWTHKDLLKLSHFKWEGLEMAVIAVYILFGMKKAELVAEGNDSVSNILSRLKMLDDLKRSEDEKQIVELVRELQCPLERVPSFFHDYLSVWEVILPELPLRDIISNLPRMHKLGFLKLNTPFQNKVIELLTNSDKIQSSKIHPSEVFVGIRTFEKGGRATNPKFKFYLNNLGKEDPEKVKSNRRNNEPIKSPNIVSALHKAMQISFQNPQSWGRRVMLTIDVTAKMELPCLNNRNLSCLEAATILTLSILRVEKDVTVAIFNDTKIRIVTIEKNATFNQAFSKLKHELGSSSYCLPSSPFEWAMSRKKPVDIFINFLYYHHWLLLLPKVLRDKEKPIQSLNNYRKKMTLPHAKLVTFSLSSHNLEIADDSPNVLDISGFDSTVPLILEAFSKGLF